LSLLFFPFISFSFLSHNEFSSPMFFFNSHCDQISIFTFSFTISLFKIKFYYKSSTFPNFIFVFLFFAAFSEVL